MRESLKAYAPLYEISSEHEITGRRKIKVVLHEIHPDPSVYQENGISWNEEYVLNNLQSVSGMSIVAEFLTDEKDVPYGHGMTDILGTLPVFEDATVVGHFERGYVDTIEINGANRRVLVAEGLLDEMRYPKFVGWLREHMQDSVVKGSVEIVGTSEQNGHIVYADGWKETGRVPMIYDYSGYAILSIKPADESAIVLELNNKQDEKEGNNMDEKQFEELKETISNAIVESNSKNDEYEKKLQEKDAEINTLKTSIEEKDAEINQLKVDAEEAKTAKENAEAKAAELNAKVASMENEKAVADLNSALEGYTEEQMKIAESEINSFKENPGCIEINSIVGKICTEIVRLERENSRSEDTNVDIFGGIEDINNTDSEINIF